MLLGEGFNRFLLFITVTWNSRDGLFVGVVLGNLVRVSERDKGLSFVRSEVRFLFSWRVNLEFGWSEVSRKNEFFREVLFRYLALSKY